MPVAASSVATAATLERGETAELFEPRIYLRPLELAETFHAELFAAEAAHHRTVNHGAAQFTPADVVFFQIEPLLGQVADEAARKAVARAGWIEDGLEQVPGHGEVRVFAKQHRAILAALDHQSMRTHAENRARGLPQIVVPGEHARLTVIDQQEIPSSDSCEQLFTKILDPEIHRVAASQANLLHLRADAGLQARLNIPHHQIRSVQIA